MSEERTPTDPPSSNGSGTDPATPGLPPVTPPSAGFILQLFLVPGILVAVIVAFIWVFFGWIGGGPQTPEEFLEGLKSPNQLKRHQTAERLAQILQRDDGLASSSKFALDLAQLLDERMEESRRRIKEGKGPAPRDDLADEFLPLAISRFTMPVGVSLLAEQIDWSQGAIHDRDQRLRLRNAVWSLALTGESLKRYDALPVEAKARITGDLKAAAGPGPERRARGLWAQEALEYLAYRAKPGGVLPPLAGQVLHGLRQGADARDEITRKLTVAALANWDEPGTERLLLQLAASNADLEIYGDETEEEVQQRVQRGGYDANNRARGQREVSTNAALALVRRAVPRIGTEDLKLVKDRLLEALDEAEQRRFYVSNEGAALEFLAKAIRDVGELKIAADRAAKAGADPKSINPLANDPDLSAALQALAKSDSVRVRVEAKKVLGLDPEAVADPASLSRQALLIVGVGLGVLCLLTLAVVARWRRAPTPARTNDESRMTKE